MGASGGGEPKRAPRLAPADHKLRRERLPWQTPKSSQDDPQALERVQEILRSPGYRQADEDTDFLNLDETRGVRLQVDYVKPEALQLKLWPPGYRR